MLMMVDEREAELLRCFRGASEFNRGRILTLTREAHQDFRWTQNVRDNNSPGRSTSAESPRGIGGE